MSHPITLRPYQATMVETILARLPEVGRLIGYLPTGGGKTRVATAITQHTLAHTAGRVIILANRKQLVHQFAGALRAAGLDVGIAQGENTTGLHHRVVVCSIDTIHARKYEFEDVALFIIDEAHGAAGSAKYRDLLFRYNLIRCIGLSATPFAKGLGKSYPELGNRPLFAEIVVGETVQGLVDQGFLTDIDIYCPSAPDMRGAKLTRTPEGESDYRQADIDKAADRPELVGDIILHWLKLAGGKKTICFASSIPHSKHIVDEFSRHGICAGHIDCYTPDEIRAEIFQRFEQGEFTVLSNVALLSEGFDVPDTACMILARPTRSLTRFLQMVGRVLRPAPGKENALLLDHSGSVQRIGHPFDELPLHLCDGRPNQAAARTRDKPLPKPCPSCKFIKPAGVHECPKCGFAPERKNAVTVKDGELHRLERGKKRPPTPDERQHAYSQLLHVAKHRGYASGWVAHKFRALFGVWPRGFREVTATPTDGILNFIKSEQIRYSKAQKGAQGARDHG